MERRLVAISRNRVRRLAKKFKEERFATHKVTDQGAAVIWSDDEGW